MHEEIIVKGAREHNLKNISVSLPRNKLVVITGLSGSGKSSLAFDTIYAEGQRRYVESLSAYARQFLELMEKPDVDLIEGLSPAISIEQKTSSRNPRSTVGTVTEIYDYLRLLYARIGRVFCYGCGREIASQTAQQIVDQVLQIPEGKKLMVLAPVVRGRKGEFKKELNELRKKGFVRVRINGELRSLAEDIVLDKKFKYNIETVVDRLVVKSTMGKRLSDSVEMALTHGEGSIIISTQEEDGESRELLFSEKFACSYCGISYPELEPRLFSFNNPQGACSRCDGLGTKMVIDPELVIPDKTRSIRDGAIKPWEKRTSINFHQMLESLATHFKFSLNKPFKDIPKEKQDILLGGSGDEPIKYFFEKDGKREFYMGRFDGIVPDLERRYHETDSHSAREEIARYMRALPCPLCKGTRLKKEGISVRVGEKNIVELTAGSIENVHEFFKKLKLTTQESSIARRIVKEIKERLGFLSNVGLDYLTLNRSSATLSGGESQRIRLATQIGSALMGVLYVLDEPSIGLHQRDNDRLLKTLLHLRDIGNTVLVVEHDEATILASDHIVDMGPGAGVHGGEITFSGTPKSLLKDKNSLTGQYLSGRKTIDLPRDRRKAKHFIEVHNASQNNLQDISVKFPLGCFVCVTGVSGSGKSTLTIDILYKALAAHFWGATEQPGKFDSIDGIHLIDKVIDIDQSPIGRTPRSNPATYTGVFTLIREMFSQVPDAKVRGYSPGRFSFNVKGGRCEACQGDGVLKVEMHFLPDVFVTCEVCHGKRFNRETLEVHYKGKSIADVLEMTVEEAKDFFQNIPAIKVKLQTITDVGLNYVHLGQPATTLSGGEAQRVKLSKELSKRSTGRTLYILDEPTTGLHFADIEQLLRVLSKLVDHGNTVIVIEHNMDVIKTADHIIDLGPEGGDKGGKIIAEGTPEEVAKNKNSYTGQYLKNYL